MKFLLPILMFLSSNLMGQSLSPDEKDFNYPNFRDCGLVTRYSSQIIPPQCLTEANNVYFDEDFSLMRRNGYGKYNNTPCTDSKSIRGLWNFSALDGQKYILIFSSRSFFYTKGQGDCVAIPGLSNFSSASEFECVQSLGAEWCTNGVESMFNWNGTSTNTVTAGGKFATKIGAFRNRIMLGDVGGSKTRILLSAEGDGTNWTLIIPGASTTPASIDISGTNDGQTVKCLMGQYQDSYFIGRDNDLWGLYGNSREDFTLRQISKEIGCIEQRSVREKNNCLYWLSKRGYEKMCGTNIERVSDPVRDNLEGIISAAGNTRSKSYDSQSEWEAGYAQTQIPNAGPLSTTVDPGFVVPSTWSHTNSTGTDWNGGTLVNIDSTTVPNTIRIYGLDEFFYDNFEDGNYTSNPTWNAVTLSGSPFFSVMDWSASGSDPGFSKALTIIAGAGGATSYSESGYFSSTGAVNVSNASLTYNFWSYINSSSNAGSHSSYSRLYFGGNNINNGYFLQFNESNTNLSCTSRTAALYKNVAGNGQLLASDASISQGGQPMVCSISCPNLTITFNSGGQLTASDSGCGLSISATDTDQQSLGGVMASSFTAVFQYGAGPNEGATSGVAIEVVSDTYVEQPYSTATWTSPIYDTTFSTPIGGPYSFTEDVPAGSTVAYQVRQSTANDGGGFGSWITVSTTVSGEYRIPLTKRYWQDRVYFSTDYSTQSPSVSMTALEATTSGYYIADCVDTTGMSSWGNFRPSTILTGPSLISYAVTTATSCHAATRSTATWNTQLANSPISLSTAPFLGIRVYETPFTSTDSTKLGGVTVEWNEGASRPPLASAVYKDRLWVFYTTSTASGAYNDHVLILDSSDKWSLFDDIYGYSAVVFNNNLYVGDSRNTGTIYQQNIGNDDDDANYKFSVKTNDYDFGNPAEKKLLKRIYLYVKSESVVGQNINISLKYYIDGSTTAYSLSAVNLNESIEPGYFVAKFPARVALPSTFHYLKLGLEYTGNQGPVNVYGIKVVYRPIEWD